ncbi:hypothetical protein C9I98_06905 [Photobacterium sanctipauli]|uniref:AMP-dependent synthetase/ligase domain-containing protein n=1 Tax=Photobacterium sanctipauli TaxID=1342794 RepID=A0A2T3NWF4_9GAMM|nr:AMP-binding protein [Photobacterium sanctipauli]PSW20576.1 hypothetical protein C9I98_06905 [Photobacterium sanctipauli]
MNIGSLFERSALFWSERTALKDERKSLTYSQLDERSNRVVNTLASLGIEQGQRVAVLAWNRVEIVEVEIALYKGGFVRVPINARLSPEETVHVCNDSQANLLIVDPEHLNAGMLALSKCPTLSQLLVMGEGIEECSYEDALRNAAMRMH